MKGDALKFFPRSCHNSSPLDKKKRQKGRVVRAADADDQAEFGRHPNSLRIPGEFPMRRFLNNLIREFRTNTTARPAQAPRRASLQLQCLDDRIVPTTVSQSGSVLTIKNIASGDMIALQSNGSRGLEVYDNNTLVDKNNIIN